MNESMRRSAFGLLPLLAVMVWTSVAAAEGLYWESKVSGMGRDTTVQNYAMPKMIKIVRSDGNVVILRADQEKFLMLNVQRQTYHEMTFAQLESAANTMGAQMAVARGELEKRMKDMSPDQRAAMEKMLPKNFGDTQAAASPVSVKATNETKTIAGHKCTKTIATQDGKQVLTAWIAKDVDGFDALHQDWVTLQKRLSSVAGPLGGGLAEAYSKIDGFPLETETNEVTTQVTKIESRTTPESEFTVPAGYKKEAAGPPNMNP
ncbi:MAG TPA: DUF4412 domain-containing protein [Candidatus Acidoferrales bacterium]|nr:DUF4412 domain-containing protein [Candidatus Acidoferrales bacterium]